MAGRASAALPSPFSASGDLPPSKGVLPYRIERTHPFVKRALETDAEQKAVVKALLRLLEETVPVAQIWLDTAGRGEVMPSPFAGSQERELKEGLKMLYEGFLQQVWVRPLRETSRRH